MHKTHTFMHAYITFFLKVRVKERDMERREASFIWRPNANAEISPSCPRCGSSNTKFCYYNNYSLTQPRYFCKGCRRYWTKGGSLRNVPVGGGCRRKTRRPKSSSHTKTGLTTNSCSSGGGDGSPNIDLALVYANFLNPNPSEPTHIDNLTDVSMEPSWSMNINDHSNQNIMEECGYDGLPPFPGEELLSNGVWSNALLIGHNHVDVGSVALAQAVNEPLVRFADESNDSTNLMFGSWSPFDFSADG